MKTKLLSILALLISNLCFSQMNYPIPMESTSEWRLYRNTWDGSGGPVYYRDFRVFVELSSHRILQTGFSKLF